MLETTPKINLADLLQRAVTAGIATTAYTEPDLDDAVTAVAFSPGVATRRLLANLPLAGQHERRNAQILDMIFDGYAPDDIYHDTETGIIDMEWHTDDGNAHFQFGTTKYTGYIQQHENHPNALPVSYHKGKLRDLAQTWPSIHDTLEKHIILPKQTLATQA